MLCVCQEVSLHVRVGIHYTACYGVQYRLMFSACNSLFVTQGDDYLLILVLILIEYSTLLLACTWWTEKMRLEHVIYALEDMLDMLYTVLC